MNRFRQAWAALCDRDWYHEAAYQQVRADAAEKLLTNAHQREVILVKSLRDMDQLAFSISQCSSIEQMRPHIQQLVSFASERQQAESARIRGKLIPEIIATYGEGLCRHKLPPASCAVCSFIEPNPLIDLPRRLP